MFSSTMMASSITTPTISVSASMVIMLSVNPMAAINANEEMIEVGMAMAEMIVVRQLARKKKITMAASRLPSPRCALIFPIAALMKMDWSEMISQCTSLGSVGA